MMTYVLIWLSAHRTLMIFLIGISLWAAAYMWYFKGDWDRFWMDRRPHKWSVDMAARKAHGGRKRAE